MGRMFKLDKEPFRKGEVLYAKRKVTIEPGVTVLVGCNGTGKTTLLKHYIKDQLRAAKIPYMEYDNLSDGGNNARQMALRQGRMDLLAELACSSEGEQISTNIGNVAGRMGQFVKTHKGAAEMWFLFDAIDSGLSIDNVLDVKAFFKTVIERNPGTDVYIVVSANAYEMARGEKCLDVRGCRYREFKTYESFRKFILKSKEAKIARYAGCGA